MPQTADTVRQAVAQFGPGFPRDRVARIQALESEAAAATLLAAFAELDETFYRLIDSENTLGNISPVAFEQAVALA